MEEKKEAINIVLSICFMQYKNIAVFCGSKSGNNATYLMQAKELGTLMAKHKLTLIYGGGSVGLMGAIADAVLEDNGKVIGVIPDVLMAWEQQHQGLSNLHIVADMHIRKKMMYEICDAAVALPGGYGTLDELFEITTWNNLKIHEKKIILLNSAGFYNHLIAHIEAMQADGFLYEDWQKRIIVCETPEEVISFLVSGKH